MSRRPPPLTGESTSGAGITGTRCGSDKTAVPCIGFSEENPVNWKIVTDFDQNKVTSCTGITSETTVDCCSLEGCCCAQQTRCLREESGGGGSPLNGHRHKANMCDVIVTGRALDTCRETTCKAHLECDVQERSTGTGDWLKLRSSRTKRGSTEIAPYYFQLDPSTSFSSPSDHRRTPATHGGRVYHAGTKPILERTPYIRNEKQ